MYHVVRETVAVYPTERVGHALTHVFSLRQDWHFTDNAYFAVRCFGLVVNTCAPLLFGRICFVVLVMRKGGESC